MDTGHLWSALLLVLVACSSLATCRTLDPEEEPGLFEGDIALPSVVTADDDGAPGEPEARNGLNRKQHATRLWPQGVVTYAISPLYSASEMILIEKSIRMINAMTCVRFVPLQRQLKEGEDLLLIWPVKYPKGCWSYIGRLGGVQILSLEKGRDVDDALNDDGSEQIDEADERLADVASWLRQKFGWTDPGAVPVKKKKKKTGCFGAEGRVMHELLHSLGMFHEQSRPDRDKFIDIHPENIIKGFKNNFNKQSSKNATHAFEYDFLSIMHYGATYFSKSKSVNTITVKKKYLKRNPDLMTETPLGESLNIGQRIGLTKFDCLKVNDLYGCLNSNTISRMKYYHICRIMGL